MARQPHSHGLDEVIADRVVRGLYHRLLAFVSALHDDVRVEESDVDVRVAFGEHALCRVVPYRELVHVQIGTEGTWETRLRDEQGFRVLADRVLREFVATAARRAGTDPPRRLP
ncbi:MAG: hypothetical protein OEO21_05760 [Candidatus Krumholzibacteria bacterium]|nr:hypothetical protein [Candidatus Krumholzibacteria bacterium]